jgi:hypothetical protein
MTDIGKLLGRQAEWQKRQQALTWPEKVRMAEAIRESVAKLRRPRQPGGTGLAPPNGEHGKPQH